jgi:two-component system, NarL family, invasion response regulator UvrY
VRNLTSVLLVDDHAVVREGYKRLLERSGEIEVVGEAATAADAYRLFCELAPLVVIMDISLPGASGIEALRRIRARDEQARVLMFSMHGDAIFARRALVAGAVGYLTKASAPETLVEAVQSVARNEPYLSRDVAQLLALRTSDPKSGPSEPLSPREHEVLRLWMLGHAPGDIATALGLSQKTVANLQSSLKQKLRAETAAQLWRNAVRFGLAPESAQQMGAEPEPPLT